MNCDSHTPVTNNSATGLYFSLSGTMYQPGDSVLITDIGVFTAPTLEGTGSSLVCHTDNVNTMCCRGVDGGNVGDWYFPDGTIVPRNSEGGAITRSGFTQQVRLNRNNANALMPTGDFSCRVPEENDLTVICRNDITVILGMYRVHEERALMPSLLCVCPCAGTVSIPATLRVAE